MRGNRANAIRCIPVVIANQSPVLALFYKVYQKATVFLRGDTTMNEMLSVDAQIAQLIKCLRCALLLFGVEKGGA